MIFDCFAKITQFNNNRQKPCRLLTSLTSNNLKYKTTATMFQDTVGGSYTKILWLTGSFSDFFLKTL